MTKEMLLGALRQLKKMAPVAVVLFSGCAVVGPDYAAPTLSDAEIPQQWTSSTETSANDGQKDHRPSLSSQWWTELADSVLDHLVTEGFATSPTIDAAIAKIRQSRAMYARANASSVPTLDTNAEGRRASADSGGTALIESWLSMNASWEVDLFGAVRRGKEGAIARTSARQATLADVRVSLAADITDAYLNYRAGQSYAALSVEDVSSREATEKLTEASVKEGFTAPYQAIRSKASVSEARTQLAAARAFCSRQENLLTRLSGVPRPTLMVLLEEQPTGLDRLPTPKHFGITVPGQALMQRPDIRAAERDLAAASADIGLAEADRYPRLALNGTLGYSVTGNAGSGALSLGYWSFGPSLSLPLLDGGRREAAVEMAQAKYDEALANFKTKARSALQEVEDALTRYAAAHERAENARVSASQYQRFFQTVEVRYREGASNLLELEDARRAMLSAQQTLLNVLQERLQAWVALNRATGGSAQYESDRFAPSAASATETTRVN